MKNFEIYKLGEVVVISALTEERTPAVPTGTDTGVPPPGGIALNGWNLEPSEPTVR
jgi:hypothetical protein